MRSGGWNQQRKQWAHLLPVRASRPYQSQLCHLETGKGVVESEDSYRYSRSRYSRRQQSPLTNCLYSYRCCHFELLNVQKALISYSNQTQRQQFSHRYTVQCYGCHTGLPSRSSPYSYFLDFPSYQSTNWIWRPYNSISERKPAVYNRVISGTYDRLYKSTFFLCSKYTSGYLSFQARVLSMRYEINQFWWDNEQGEIRQ